MNLQALPTRCAVCGKRLLTGRAALDLWGNVYCEMHRNEYPACSACNRLVCTRLTGGGETYSDGRVVCKLCRATALDSKEQAKPIVEGVAGWLYERGVRFTGLILKIDLADARQMGARMGQPFDPGAHKQAMGFIGKYTERRKGRQRRVVQGVTVLSGLPRVLFEGVVAHELGHAWLYLAHVDGLQPWAEEGFCNLLSYALHKNRGTAEDQHWVKVLEQSPDPVYGEGFRRVRAIFKKYGFGEALNYTFRRKRFPPE